MTDDMMRDEYDKYLQDHITAVKRGHEWLIINLPELFEEYDADNIAEMIIHHDESKYSDEEYYAYCEYFYGNKTDDVKSDFDYAWLHHQHNNPHHWQHWLLQQDDSNWKLLEIPYPYIIEMICDWWAFSWVKGNLTEIFDWYADNKLKILMNKKSKEQVEHILDLLKNKLEEVGTDVE